MTELRVVVPAEVAKRLAQVANERGASAEDVAAEVLNSHAPDRRTGPLFHRHVRRSWCAKRR